MFLAVGAAGMLSALLIRFTVPAQGCGQSISLSTIGLVLFDPVLLPAYRVVFYIAGGVHANYAFIAPSSPAYSMAVRGIAGVPGNLFVVRAAMRYSADTMLVFGMGLLAADLLVLLLAPPTFALLFAVLVLWAFATDIVCPTRQCRIVELSEELRGAGADGILCVCRHRLRLCHGWYAVHPPRLSRKPADGEPDALKGPRPVRRGEAGDSPTKSRLLLYSEHRI